jgi:integrase
VRKPWAGSLASSPETRLPTPNLTVNRFLHELELKGRAKETIAGMTSAFRHLLKVIPDLDNPYEAREYLARVNIKNSSKKKLVWYLNDYYKFIGKQWEMPKYTAESRLPYIPTEQELDILIASAGRKYQAFLEIIKETGMRTDEAHKLEWTDLDLTRNTVNVTASKNSNGRILPISERCKGMLNAIKNNQSTRIFPQEKKTIRTCFYHLRKKVATKYSNPRMMKITLHTFRHYKGTTEYHKTKDIIHVKTVLGHKSIESTMIYINLESATFLTDSDEYTCKTAKTAEEASQLIEAGFQYVTTIEGIQLFKKRK